MPEGLSEVGRSCGGNKPRCGNIYPDLYDLAEIGLFEKIFDVHGIINWTVQINV